MIHEKYNAILSGSLNSKAEAIEWARGMVWGEVETTTQDIKHGDHITTVQGDVGVWYDYVGDYYFFTEEEQMFP